ncbi:MAG: cupin domain-containing protein [Bacteroides sp.]|nr:cupin domain-containing protein [Bacteroides sp.]
MKTRSANFQIESEMAWEKAREGIQRQIMGYDGQLMLVKVKFEKGAVGTAHEHYHSQATFIVSGVFEFHTEGETRVLRPGDGIYIAPDALHGCTCLEAGVLIDTFSPVRADFLKK